MKSYSVLILWLVLICLSMSCTRVERVRGDGGDCYSGESAFAIAYFGDVTRLKKRKFSKQEVNVPAQGKGCRGWTPVMIASAEGHTAMVKELISLGANVNAANDLGRTALMFASSYGYEQIVEDLLKAGADPNIVTKSGGPRKAIIAAAEHAEVSVILLNHKYGAKISGEDCAGYEDACIRIAAVLGGVNLDFEQSNQLLRPICAQGNPVACHMISVNQCAVEHPSDPEFCEKELIKNQ